MNHDLHLQLHDLFTRQAEELRPTVPDRFDPGRPTTLTTGERPDRRRPLLAAAAAISLIAGTSIVLAQRHPNTPETPPLPATTTTPDDATTTAPTTATTAPASTTTWTVGSPAPAPSEADGIPPTQTVALPRTLLFTGSVRFVGNGSSVLVTDTPTEYSFDATRGVAVGGGEGADVASSFVFDLTTGEVIHEFPWGVQPFIVSDDGTRFFDGVSLWDLTTGEEVGDQAGVTSAGTTGFVASFSPNSALLAFMVPARVDSYELHLVDATTGASLWVNGRAIGSGPGTQPALRFSDDSATVYLGDQIHDLATGKRLAGTAPTRTGPTDGFSDPDVVNVVDGRLETCLVSHVGCSISPDGSRVVMLNASFDSVEIWHIDQLPPAPANRGVPPTHTFDVPNIYAQPRFLPDGRSILIGDPNGATEYVYDTTTGDVVRSFPGAEVFAPKLFDFDGTRYFDGKRLWDLALDESLGTWDVAAAGFSPDGHLLGLETKGGAFLLVDTRNGATIWETEGGVGGGMRQMFMQIRFSADGTQIFLEDQVFDLATGELVEGGQPAPAQPTTGFWDPALVEALDAPFDACDPLDHRSSSQCDITPDGSMLAMFANGTVLIWELGP